MNTKQLPDDLNPAVIEATAIFIGKVTGLIPPPTDAFPREWYAPLRTFTKRLYQIAGENAPAAPRDDPTPLDDETVAVIRSFVDRPGETYRGVITRRLGIGLGRALRRAIEESRAARASDAAGAPLTDGQRAAIQAAVDTASRVLRAGGDELSDAGLRRELKESRDMLRDMLAATVARPAVAPIESYSIDGTVRFMRSEAGNQVCVCCPPGGGHIFSRYVEWDEWQTRRAAHFGNGPDVFVGSKVTDFNHNEGKRVRLTVEVLDETRATAPTPTVAPAVVAPNTREASDD